MPYGIYLHIPFCRRRCHYCHFAITANQPTRHLPFLEALKQEWERRKGAVDNLSLRSIYFGGGTPSLLAPRHIETILSRLPPAQEVTLEANPEDVSWEKIANYNAAGVNRISLGVQTLNDHLLQAIGRHHTAQQAVDAIQIAYRAGIENISADVMLELPDQTVGDVKRTLSTLTALPITHLSLYNLTIEAPAPYFYRQTQLKLPDEEHGLQMLHAATSLLQQAGFVRYEISAFAKGPHRAIHNTGYWTGRPFLGLGPSASSYLNHVRTRNHPSLTRYLTLEDPTDQIDPLPPEARDRELLVLGLRLLEGVDLTPFTLDRTPLHELEQQGLLLITGNRAQLTEQGLLLHDTVAATLI